MTTEELTALAIDAGNMDRRLWIGKATGQDVSEAYEALRTAIKQALEEARADERELAARVCDGIEAAFVAQWRYGTPSSKAKDCAAAIRKGRQP